MNQPPENDKTPVITGEKLEKPGVFKQGDDPRRNLGGRPKGALAFKTALEKWAFEMSGKMKDKDGNQIQVSALELVTHKLMEMALAGNILAIKEISDRLDGKAKLSIDHTTDGLPIIQIDDDVAKKYEITRSTEEDSEKP